MKGVPRVQEVSCRNKKCPFNTDPRHCCGRCSKKSITITKTGCLDWENILRDKKINFTKIGTPKWKKQQS